MRQQYKHDDGSRSLLRSGGVTVLIGLISTLLTTTVFGGIGPNGPNTNAGWLGLIITMICLPFGCMVLLLGAAKWLRKRKNESSN